MPVVPPLLLSVLLGACVPLSLGAGSNVYRCVSNEGLTTFQHTRCAGGGETIDVKTTYSGWSALRDGEQKLLRAYRERDARMRQRRTLAAMPDPAADTRTCRNKRKRLAAVNTQLRRGYKASAGASLRARRDDYQDYLKEYCP